MSNLDAAEVESNDYNAGVPSKKISLSRSKRNIPAYQAICDSTQS